MSIEKFKAAISDTDIILDLYKSDLFSLLGILFEKIFITELVYERELKKVARSKMKINYADLIRKIEDEESIFEIVYEKDLDIETKNIKKIVKNERKYWVGPGEVDCAAYAHASSIDFVVSNNHTEFEFLNDICIMLSYDHILTISVLHDKLTFQEAKTMYRKINSQKKHSSSHSFKKKMELSKEYFNKCNYTQILKIEDLAK